MPPRLGAEQLRLQGGYQQLLSQEVAWQRVRQLRPLLSEMGREVAVLAPGLQGCRRIPASAAVLCLHLLSA